MDDTKLSFLLDLFYSGYKNAYVSVMFFLSEAHKDCQRIEIFLPNVGCLLLYQYFDDASDEQIPKIDVFYIGPGISDSQIQITNIALLNRAVKIIYTTKRFFETHPEYSVSDSNLINRIQKNRKFLKHQYDMISKAQMGILRTYGK